MYSDIKLLKLLPHLSGANKVKWNELLPIIIELLFYDDWTLPCPAQMNEADTLAFCHVTC